MKIEIESEALDTLKAMCEQLQSERDELLEVLKMYRVQKPIDEVIVYADECASKADELIAKCTKEPELM